MLASILYSFLTDRGFCINLPKQTKSVCKLFCRTFSFDKPNPSGKDNAVKGARGNARKIIACLYGKTADPLWRIGLKFSATIFPLDGNGFFRYHPQIERIYPLSPQFGKILGAIIVIIISFGAGYGYCIG